VRAAAPRRHGGAAGADAVPGGDDLGHARHQAERLAEMASTRCRASGSSAASSERSPVRSASSGWQSRGSPPQRRLDRRGQPARGLERARSPPPAPRRAARRSRAARRPPRTARRPPAHRSRSAIEEPAAPAPSMAQGRPSAGDHVLGVAERSTDCHGKVPAPRLLSRQTRRIVFFCSRSRERTYAFLGERPLDRHPSLGSATSDHILSYYVMSYMGAQLRLLVLRQRSVRCRHRSWSGRHQHAECTVRDWRSRAGSPRPALTRAGRRAPAARVP